MIGVFHHGVFFQRIPVDPPAFFEDRSLSVREVPRKDAHIAAKDKEPKEATGDAVGIPIRGL